MKPCHQYHLSHREKIYYMAERIGSKNEKPLVKKASKVTTGGRQTESQTSCSLTKIGQWCSLSCVGLRNCLMSRRATLAACCGLALLQQLALQLSVSLMSMLSLTLQWTDL